MYLPVTHSAGEVILLWCESITVVIGFCIKDAFSLVCSKHIVANLLFSQFLKKMGLYHLLEFQILRLIF